MGYTGDKCEGKLLPIRIALLDIQSCLPFINPWHPCAARVTVVESVGQSVCLLINISLLEHPFVLKRTSRTQRAMKVKKLVWISLKLLRCRDMPLPDLYNFVQLAILAFSRIRVHLALRVLHFRVHSFLLVNCASV